MSSSSRRTNTRFTGVDSTHIGQIIIVNPGGQMGTFFLDNIYFFQ